MVSKSLNSISNKVFNKLTNKQKERIIKNRNSARKSYLKRNKKKQNLIMENKLIKETLDIIKTYFDNLNLLKNINELSNNHDFSMRLPKLYDEEISIIYY